MEAISKFGCEKADQKEGKWTYNITSYIRGVKISNRTIFNISSTSTLSIILSDPPPKYKTVRRPRRLRSLKCTPVDTTHIFLLSTVNTLLLKKNTGTVKYVEYEVGGTSKSATGLTVGLRNCWKCILKYRTFQNWDDTLRLRKLSFRAELRNSWTVLELHNISSQQPANTNYKLVVILWFDTLITNLSFLEYFLTEINNIS